MLSDDASDQSILRIDEACDRFEEQWKSGDRPQIEAFLSRWKEPARSLLFQELLLLDICYRTRQGETPSIDEYGSRFPEYRAMASRALDIHARAEDSSTANDRPMSNDDATLTYSVRRKDGDVAPFAVAANQDEMALAFGPGVVLHDRYILQEEIGRGGMGVVYLGRDNRLERYVAIKVVSSRAIRTRSHKDELQRMFAEEARIGAALLHPAIATVFDFGIYDGNPFTVFEYVAGETLRCLLRRRGRLSLEEVRYVLSPLAQALDYAHSHHVVHRDLKPENVRVTEQGYFKILDLGLAIEFNRQQEWRFAGTPAYASPEQAAEQPSDGRSDQYALAVIVYEMLTGKRPFPGCNVNEVLNKHRTEMPPAPQMLASDISISVSSALLRALAKDPERRFHSCEDFAAALGCQMVRPLGKEPEIVAEAEVVPLGHVDALDALRLVRSLPSKLRLDMVRHTRWIVLSADTLWSSYQDVVYQWPLQVLTAMTQRGRVLSFELRLNGKEQQEIWEFPSEKECDRWHSEICQRRKKEFSSGLVRARYPRQKSVLLLHHRPRLRLQQLGAVETKTPTRRQNEMSLRVRAAILGADAVMGMERQVLIGFDQNLIYGTGVAVRTTDVSGRATMVTCWFGEALSEIVKLMVWLAVIAGLALMACNFFMLYVAFDPLRERFLRQPEMTATPALVSLARLTTSYYRSIYWVVAVSFFWPAAVGVLLRRLKWPQLVTPTAGAFALMIAPLFGWLFGVVLAMTFNWNWPADQWVVMFFMVLISVLLGNGLVYAVKVQNLYRGYLAAMPPITRTRSMLRTALATALWGLHVIFSAAVAIPPFLAGFLVGTGAN